MFLRENGRQPNDQLFYKPIPNPEAMFDFQEPIQESHFSQGYIKRLLGYFEKAGMKLVKEVIYLLIIMNN